MSEERGGGPGFKRLRANPEYANMVERTLAEQRRAIEEVAAPKPTSPTTRDQPQRGYPKVQGSGTKCLFCPLIREHPCRTAAEMLDCRYVKGGK